MSVRRCQEEIGPEEFGLWMAYYSLEPFGEERADYRSGIISCTFANVMRAKGGRRLSVQDFMPKFGKNVSQDIDEMRREFAAFTRMHNASLKGKK